MGLASIFLRPFVTPIAIDLLAKSTTAGNACESLGSYKSVNSKLSRLKVFRLNCSIDRDATVSASVLADSIAKWSSEEQTSELSLSIVFLNFDNEFDPYGAISTPIYQTATFKQRSATENGPYDYTRSENPTRDALARLLAKLDKADRAFCFSSGMAALNAASQPVGTGEEIVAGDDLYGGSDRLLSKVIPKSGVMVRQVNTSDLEEVASAIGPQTKLAWVENPTNPQIQIPDIRVKNSGDGSCTWCSSNGRQYMMPPVLCQPLEIGADIVMHSAIKFIGGRCAIIAGVFAVKCDRLAKDLCRLYLLQNAVGSGLAPFNCWLCLQGIKTKELRVEKQQENAQKIGEFLASHPRVKKVNYASLPGHPGHDLHYSQGV